MTRLSTGPIAAALLAATAAPLRVEACGAFFGAEVEVAPDQKIVLIHRDGVLTYVFRPRFCGTAAEFGVILPVPAALSASPALDESALYDELDRFTAPETVESCEPVVALGCGASGEGGALPGFGTGVDVVDRGRVGVFEWALLQATSTDAFTGWLEANGFPFDPGDTSGYEHYVAESWYFVAFKVSAGAGAPPAGMRLCGDLGPIRLSFPSPRPVVPARITSVNTAGAPTLTWRVFVVAGGQQRVPLDSPFFGSVHFAGTLRHAELGDSPELAAASRDGERLTALDVRFPQGNVVGDIVLEEDPAPFDRRSVEIVRKDCGGAGGCDAGGTPTGLAGVMAALLLLRTLGRGSRRARGAAPPR